MSTTAERLRQAMADVGLDQSAIARHIGVTQGAISLILLGKTTRSRYLPEIAQLLGVSLAWLRGEDVSRQPTASEMLPMAAPTTIRMDVVLPSATALTNMFYGLLGSFDEGLPRAELARGLALHLPVALAQLQGPLVETNPETETLPEAAAPDPATDRRALRSQPRK